MTYFVQVYPLNEMSNEDFTRFVCKAINNQSPIVMVEQASYTLRVGYIRCQSKREAESIASKLDSVRCGGFTVKTGIVDLYDDFVGQVVIGETLDEKDSDESSRKRSSGRSSRKHQKREKERHSSRRSKEDQIEIIDDEEIQVKQKEEVKVSNEDDNCDTFCYETARPSSKRERKSSHRRKRSNDYSDSEDNSSRRHSHHHRHH